MEQIQSLVPNHNSQEIDEPKCKELTSRVVAHYQSVKSRIACDNLFLLFSPTWLSSLELSFFWVAGFKPSLVFWLVTDSVLDLAKEQARRMQVIVAETKEKKGIGHKVGTDSRGCGCAIHDGIGEAGGDSGEGLAVERLRLPMEELVGNADMLRSKTVGKVMEILSSAQAVKFLVAAASAQNSSVGDSERC